jgi:hypothetical protein
MNDGTMGVYSISSYRVSRTLLVLGKKHTANPRQVVKKVDPSAQMSSLETRAPLKFHHQTTNPKH